MTSRAIVEIFSTSMMKAGVIGAVIIYNLGEGVDSIYETIKEHPGNLQTNYYFDTKRFTLKATDAVLRVKHRETYTLTLERKKGYNFIRIDEEMTEEEFKDLVENGNIHSEKIAQEVNDIIKGQKIINFMNLATYRISVPYKKGKLSLDRCEYVNTIDYELEYEVANRNTGKLEFIQIIKDYNIAYKKSQVKLKRAYDALRKTL
jgi:uncharacterized protein YjbK